MIEQPERNSASVNLLLLSRYGVKNETVSRSGADAGRTLERNMKTIAYPKTTHSRGFKLLPDRKIHFAFVREATKPRRDQICPYPPRKKEEKHRITFIKEEEKPVSSPYGFR
jgi:hypothetical protein